MKKCYFICIEEGHEKKVTVHPGQDQYVILIDADNMQEALNLIPDADKQAEQAVKDYKPAEPMEEEPAEEQKHYYKCSKSIEEMQAWAKEYEATKEGKRFIKQIENSLEFEHKHSTGKRGLHCLQLYYLACKHYNCLINGCFDLYALAYRDGFREGQQALTKKANAK